MKFFNKLNRYLSINFLRYILGRFNLIRKIYKIINKTLNSNKILFDVNNYIILKSSEDQILNDLSIEGVSKKICLKKEINEFILDNFDKCKFLSYKAHNKEKYEFNNFYEFKNSKKDIPLLELKNKDFRELFDRISRSEKILKIAKDYLGNVKKIDIRLTYSTVSNLDDVEREEWRQTVNWHFDVHDLNFLYVFFYISGADKFSGSHEVIIKSHKKKLFFKHLIGSATQSDKSLKNFYDKKDFLTIEGSEGEGFIEDTSCFHRALKPIDQTRLCLQIRYH